jgi:hypothetical protein
VKRRRSGAAAPGGSMQGVAKMGCKICISMKKKIIFALNNFQIIEPNKKNSISVSIFNP